ncbi:tetratricopeptide repeat protein [Ectobacillus sp. sgz5001026]|uniref:tetratricopeptide repeat protein n=1 Tax=Ectobacillus sp. sgz5001026 TaxID=3242473 RepID=UPI0036D4259F
MGTKQQVEKEKGQVIALQQSAQFLYEKGMKAYRRHNLQEAIKYLKRAAHTEKKPVILCQLASALSEAGQYHESNQFLNNVLRMDSSMTECYYFLANNYAFLGLFQQAKKYAERYLDEEDEGEFSDEILDLLDIIADEEDEGDEFEDEDELILLQERANRFIRNGQLEEAISTLETMLDEYPDFWSAYNNLAIARFQLGEIEKAMKIVDTVLEKNPGNIHALCNALIFLYSVGEEEQVQKLAGQLENVFPILIEQRFKLGTTLATIGKFESAYRWLNQLKRQGYEGDFSFYYWLAYSAYMCDDKNVAEKTWQRVLEIYPDKKGKEPWNAVDLADGNQSVLLTQLKHSFSSAKCLEEKMLALYLMNELQTNENEQVFFETMQSKEKSVISEWARYFFIVNSEKSVPRDLRVFAKCAQIADVLYEYTKKDDTLIEDCLQFWFRTFAALYQTNVSFSNTFGWSAAIEYMIRKNQQQKMTQAELGHIYNVSISTIRKYVQLLNQQ